MKKQIVIKIISGVIIFSFAMFFLQAISPLKVNAASTTGLNWDNPNKSGNSAYKFKPQDALNSQLIMQVVGCTGVVDKISVAVSKLFQKATQDLMVALQRKAIIKACTAAKGGAQMVAGQIPQVTITTALGTVINCNPINNTSDDTVKAQLADAALKADTEKRTTECFNGIAMTLAKNQLTAMTRYTVNWINTGFNGNPMYVQNITSLTNGIEKGVLENGLSALTAPSKAFPYGADFARSMVNSYQAGTSLRSGATNFLDSLTSDLGAFITDPTSLLPNTTLTALQKAQRANDTFAGDFSSGGWNAWLALTQKDANNPLGFAMQVSQYEADQQTAQMQGTKDELAQNNGFLSQKKCVRYSNPDGSDPQIVGAMPITPMASITADSLNVKGTSGMGLAGPAGKLGTPITKMGTIGYTSPTATSLGLQGPAGQTQAGTPVCLQWDTITPGSIIKDQLSNFVNSPVRQLELAKTINDSLNSVFSALLSKLQDQGLPGISDNQNSYVSSNITASANTASTDLLGNRVSLSSGYTDGSFDLTRDLGNIFIHNYAEKSQGNWDADKNLPELNIGVAPLDDQGNPLLNVYYTVTVAGNTKLINEGYNGWVVGDKAFWNGTSWQNWKKGTANPIANRGVIQLQKDYIVAAKELLANLPAIMPKIGKLDYCIPGPNPNWQANTANAYSAFSDYAYSLTSDYKPGSLLTRDSQSYQIAQPGQDQYDNFKKLFAGTNTFSGTLESTNARESASSGTTPELFVTKTEPWVELNKYSGLNSRNGLAQDKLQSYTGELLNKIGKDLQDFNTNYAQIIESTYGVTGLMQKQFIEREDTSELLPNTAWLPMASDGLSITKDITNYATDIDQMSQDYKDSIVQANANISKLNTIKDQVSVIIIAAQKRRDDNLLKILADEAARNNTPVLTAAQYKAKYAACLDEENIVFYEDTNIFTNIGSEAGRCNDGIDNDLNGLVDMADPACQNLNVSKSGIVGPITPSTFIPSSGYIPKVLDSQQQQVDNLVN